MMSIVIELQELTIGYGSNPPILTSIDLSLEQGSLTAIIGSSGSGKSTLLYTIGLMKRPSAGSLTIYGAELAGASDRVCAGYRATRVGYIFQDAVLDPNLSVRDNILCGLSFQRRIRRSDHERALALMDELGVDVPAERRPTHVSGGQAQRIAVARARIGRPNIILADEPTGNLDVESRDTVFEGLVRTIEKEESTVVVATHDLDLAARCDRVIEVVDGKLI